MYNRYLYLLFFLLGINASIASGLYLYDILIFAFLIFYWDRLEIHSLELIKVVSFLLLFPAIISLYYQVVVLGVFEFYSIYIVYNLALFCAYFLFLSNVYKDIHLNLNYLVIFLTIPLVLSFLMLVSQVFGSAIGQLYSVEKVHPERFGGIWGNDVNQLGYYSTVVMFVVLTTLKIKKLNLLLGLIVLTLALACIALSGMRTGLIVLFGTTAFSVLFFKNSLLSLRYYSYLILIFSFFVPIYFDDIYGYYSLAVDRFNPTLILEQLSGKSEGHLGTMYAKWFNIFVAEGNLSRILFSFYPEWKFPDSLVIFYFANGGLVGVAGCILFMMYSLFKMMRIREKIIKQYLLITILFAVIISFKGSFIFNNISMFIFTFLYFELVKYVELPEVTKLARTTQNTSVQV